MYTKTSRIGEIMFSLGEVNNTAELIYNGYCTKAIPVWMTRALLKREHPLKWMLAFQKFI